jgi:hypothetical protein
LGTKIILLPGAGRKQAYFTLMASADRHNGGSDFLEGLTLLTPEWLQDSVSLHQLQPKEAPYLWVEPKPPLPSLYGTEDAQKASKKKRRTHDRESELEASMHEKHQNKNPSDLGTLDQDHGHKNEPMNGRYVYFSPTAGRPHEISDLRNFQSGPLYWVTKRKKKKKAHKMTCQLLSSLARFDIFIVRVCSKGLLN